MVTQCSWGSTRTSGSKPPRGRRHAGHRQPPGADRAADARDRRGRTLHREQGAAADAAREQGRPRCKGVVDSTIDGVSGVKKQHRPRVDFRLRDTPESRRHRPRAGARRQDGNHGGLGADDRQPGGGGRDDDAVRPAAHAQMHGGRASTIPTTRTTTRITRTSRSSTARQLFQYGDTSAASKSGCTTSTMPTTSRQTLEARLGDGTRVSTWYDLHRDLYSVMKIERWTRVHHSLPDRRRRHVQRPRLAHDGGHREEARHRDSQGARGDAAEHHPDIHVRRDTRGDASEPPRACSSGSSSASCRSSTALPAGPDRVHHPGYPGRAAVDGLRCRRPRLA